MYLRSPYLSQKTSLRTLTTFWREKQWDWGAKVLEQTRFFFELRSKDDDLRSSKVKDQKVRSRKDQRSKAQKSLESKIKKRSTQIKRSKFKGQLRSRDQRSAQTKRSNIISECLRSKFKGQRINFAHWICEHLELMKIGHNSLLNFVDVLSAKIFTGFCQKISEFWRNDSRKISKHVLVKFSRIFSSTLIRNYTIH